MRWGIVGTGAIAAHFATALTRVPGATCVAVASRGGEGAARFTKGFGIATIVADAAALAARAEVDVVYVATPNHRHLPDCLAVIGAGKPVLCEKPLATTPEDAQAIAEAAREAGVFAMEGMWSLCTPAWIAAQDQVAAGRIGELRQFRGSFAVPQSPATMPRLFSAAEGGGALLDRGVYLLAQAQAFLGPLRLVHAAGRLGPDGVDLDTELVLEAAGGARVLIDTAIDRLGCNSVTLSGSHGRIVLSEPITAPRGMQVKRADPEAAFRGPPGPPGLKQRLKARLASSPRLRQIHGLLKGGPVFSGGLEHEIAEVEACLARGLTESPRVPLDGSVAVLALIAEAQQRMRAGT